MKVLILRSGALGDTLMLLPALKTLYKDNSFIVVGRQPGIGYLNDYASLTMDIETHGWHRLFIENSDKNIIFPVREADLVVGFFRDRDGTIGKNLRSCFPADVPVYMFPSIPSQEMKIHAASYTCLCLREAGLPADPDLCSKMAVKEALIKPASKSHLRSRIVFHPGSGDPAKNYPPRFWLDLVDSFISRFENEADRITIILGPAESSILSCLSDNLNKKAEICLMPEREQLLSILFEARFYCGHDSGISHLAAMCGANTLALFRKSDPDVWRPLGPSADIISGHNGAEDLINLIIGRYKEIL